jgi:hypothetical protein
MASGQITEAASIAVELVEADETPPAVLVRWAPRRGGRGRCYGYPWRAPGSVGAGQGSDGSERAAEVTGPA